MSTQGKTTKKKILPKAAKRRSFKAALEATNKKYEWTFAKLAK
ncbi:MAG TPA: hypothetical protein VM008_11390 [Phycisphaerae bacterium]|nr:hypothetical protein [Phycisphaerae bacterium]